MKKTIVLGLVVAVLLASVPVLFAQTALKDGTYKLEEKNYDHGYRVVLSITVKKGKLTATYDNIDKDGKSKTKDTAYQDNMFKVNKIGPKQFIPELAKRWNKVQDPSKVDAVSGASHSSESFKEYAAQLYAAAQKGDTTPITIDNKVSE